MKFLRGRRLWLIGGVFGYMLAALALSAVQNAGAAQKILSMSQSGPTATSTPTYSSPIALSADKNLIWVVNPDDDSVSVLGKLDTSTPSVIGKIFVGDEPQSIALDTDNGSGGYRVYVANAADNSVTIINFTGVNALGNVNASVETTLTTGSEPWNIVASPDGQR